METTTPKTTKTKKFVTSFRDLKTWQAAYDLAVAVHRQCELFLEPNLGLVSRINQSAADACTYIAEGFERKKATERGFSYQLADDALIQLENQLFIAEGAGYMTLAQREDLTKRCAITRRILAALQRINTEWEQKQEFHNRRQTSVC